jgi:hypothetical protein
MEYILWTMTPPPKIIFTLKHQLNIAPRRQSTALPAVMPPDGTV